MKRTLRVTLDIVVEDLPDETRLSLAKDMDIEESHLERLADVDEVEVGHVLATDSPEMWDDFFAGSEVFVQFSKVSCIGAVWQGPAEQ